MTSDCTNSAGERAQTAERLGQQVEIAAREVRVYSTEPRADLMQGFPHHPAGEDSVLGAPGGDSRVHVGPVVVRVKHRARERRTALMAQRPAISNW